MAFHSQARQDEWVLKALNQKRNGFFVDCGAFDGVKFSNTCVLEKEFGWKGICIEAGDKCFDKLKDNRNCICVHACVDGKKQRVKFSDSFGEMGGKIIDKETTEGNINIVWKYTSTLKEILDKYNAPKIIDYLSLDVEDFEERVLKDFSFDEYTFLTMSIERPSKKLKKIFKQNGYIEVDTIYRSGIVLDVLYIHESLSEVKNEK